MGTRVLTVNTGSSSAKLRVLDDEVVLATRDTAPEAVGDVVVELLGEHPVDAVGHRVVHGGPRHTVPVRVDDGVLDDLRELVPLAPLHQPVAIEAIETVQRVRPDLPSVACFDTAFHADLPVAARTYALPAEWRAADELRRYGFHGLSYAWASRRCARLLDRDDLRLVVAHLGSGASLAAIHGTRPVDTTMGFTPMDGLVMATRSGAVDPGLLLWLIEHRGLEPGRVRDALDSDSGLLGIAGSKDMREVIDRSRAGDQDAVLALEVYLHRLASGVGAMAASLGGIDALVFTGGVGERAPEVRRRTVEQLAFLGLGLESVANTGLTGDTADADLTAPGAVARTLVVAAREDLEIARGVRSALG